MDHKTAHQELEQQVKAFKGETKEGQFRNLVEGSIQGILIHRDHKPLFVNPAYAAMLGYSVEEILRMDSIIPLVSPQDQARLDKYKKDRLKGEYVPVDYEYQGVKKDGALIWLENKVRVVQWEGQPAIQITIYDISKRNLAEKELREREEGFRVLIEAADRSGQAFTLQQNKDGIEAVCVLANDTAAEITGYTQEELSNLSWIDILHPKHRDDALQRYRKRFEGEVIQDVFEVSIITKDGREVPIELSSTLSVYQGEMSLITFFRDITARRLAEEMLQQAKDELERRVEKRTVELRQSNEQLEIQKKNLEKVNTALRVLLKKRGDDKEEMEQKVLLNINELVLPYLEKLNDLNTDERQKVLLDILKSNLNDITSPFSRSLSQNYTGFTPSEMQIATLIKQGKTSKQIAELLNVSSKTVETHRRNVRKKLSLDNKKINLRTHLLSIQ